MKKTIVIRPFSALSYDVVVQGMRIVDPGWPRFARPRLRLTPVSVEGLNVHPESLAEMQPMAPHLTIDKALSPLRDEDAGNPVFEMAAKPAVPTGFGNPARTTGWRAPAPFLQTHPRVDPSESDTL